MASVWTILHSLFRLIETLVRWRERTDRNRKQSREQTLSKKAEAYDKLSKAVRTRRSTRSKLGDIGVYDDGYKRGPNS